jgi:hypothetical protein
VVVPAVGSATALAQQAVAAGELPIGYVGAYAIETAAGSVNIALAPLAIASGVWRLGATRGVPSG